MLINKELLPYHIHKHININISAVKIGEVNSQMKRIYINGIEAYDYSCFESLESILTAVSLFYRGYLAGVMTHDEVRSH